jgi:hypothetical protein
VATPPSEPSPRLATIAALGLTALSGALFWWRFQAAPPGRGPLYPLDLLHYYYPRGAGVARRLAAGELPLWNPLLCGGIPELATAQTAVLSPQTWLFALLPPETALALRDFTECLLGGAFMALWLRRLGLDALASALGGSLFLAACLLGQSLWPPMVSTLLWLPALLYAIESLARRWRWRSWLGLAAASALLALAGFPQVALYSLQAAALYALLRTLSLRGAGVGALRVLAGLALAMGLGLGVAGAQLLPTAELAAQSPRAQALSAEEIHYLGDSAGAVAALRNALDPAPKLLAFDFAGSGNYLGIASLLLLVLGAALGPPRLVWPLLAACALALLLSDGLRGDGAPLYRAYSALPFAGGFRMPERLRLVTLVAAIAVACIGLDRVARGRDGLSRRRAAATGAALVLAAAAIAAFGAPGAGPRAAAALALLGLAAATRRAPLRRLAQALLLVAAVGDLWLATAAYGPLRALPRAWTDRFHLLGHTVLDGEGLARLRESAPGQRVEIERALPATGSGAIASAERLDCLEPLAPLRWRELLRELPLSQRATLYDVAGVGSVLRPRRTDPSPDAAARAYADFQQRYRDGLDPAQGPPPGFRIERLANADALPRAYWVEGHAVRAPAEIRAHLAGGDFDFRHALLLERDPGFAAPVEPVPLRAAEIVRYEPERVEIAVEAPRDGWLVLSDAWDPGWRARCDGREAEVLRANGVFRAVRVPAGAQRVVFEYRPRSLRRGLALSGLSLALCAAVPLAARRLGRGAPPRST